MSILVVPLGSWEQHGPHLPPDTDSIIITEVARAAARGTSCLVGPTVNVTASDEHAGFPMTLSIGTKALAESLVALVGSARWTSGVVLANGHGGNADALAAAREALDAGHLPHDAWSLPAYKGSDLHAGLTETSVMLHLRPDLVDMTLAAPGATGEAGALVAGMRERGVRGVSASGVVGDPTGASAGHGRAVTEMWVSSLHRRLVECERNWVHA